MTIDVNKFIVVTLPWYIVAKHLNRMASPQGTCATEIHDAHCSKRMRKKRFNYTYHVANFF